MDLAAIQEALAGQQLDGWLLYDFRGSNPIARSVIGFDDRQIGTRRWFYLIPRSGEPVAILHAIEPHALQGAPGRHVLYRSWRDLDTLLRTHLAGITVETAGWLRQKRSASSGNVRASSPSSAFRRSVRSQTCRFRSPAK